VAVDVQGIFPEQVGSYCFVDVGLHRLSPEEGLAEARESLISVNLEKQDVGELVEAERVYLDNLHRSHPRPGTRLIHLLRGLLSDHTPADGEGAEN
jgi:hypothetical protein